MANLNLEIISFNTGGGASLGGLLSILSEHKPDICLLQEVTLNSESVNTLVTKFDYKAAVNNDQSVEKTLGTAILWKTHLQNVTVNIIEL